MKNKGLTRKAKKAPDDPVIGPLGKPVKLTVGELAIMQGSIKQSGKPNFSENDFELGIAGGLINKLNFDHGTEGEFLRTHICRWWEAQNHPEELGKLAAELNVHVSQLRFECVTLGFGIQVLPVYKRTPSSQDNDKIAYDFARLISGPYADKVCQCANPDCQLFFLNTSGHDNKKYHSSKCARHETAIKATKEKRELERKQKLDQIRQICTQLKTEGVSGDWKEWKEWICKKAGVKKWWLTRAIRNGELPLTLSD